MVTLNYPLQILPGKRNEIKKPFDLEDQTARN